MSRGRRYSEEPKLNIKKVLAVIIFIVIAIMFGFVIKKLATKEETNTGKISALNYFSVYTNNKWGVIDSLGKMTIDAKYDEMIVVPDKTKDIFICTYDVNYDSNTYKTKVIDSKNNQLFKEYDIVEPIENQDKNNNLWYEKDVLKVKQNAKYGIIDYSGKVILPCEYEEIEALETIENSIIITKDDKKGLCNNKGEIIINPEYKEILAIGNDYKNGYIIVDEDNQYGIADFNKKIILEPQFDEVKNITNSGKYVVKVDDNYKLIDKSGKILLEDGFDDITNIDDNNIIIKENNKFGVMDFEGNIKIAAKYDNMTFAYENHYIAKQGSLYGIVTLDDSEGLDFEYTSITYRKEGGFIEAEKQDEIVTSLYNQDLELKLTGIITELNEENGYMRLREEGQYNYYNFKFEKKEAKDILPNNKIFISKKDGKYGFIDKEGNVVVNYIYDDATEANIYGYASVKKDGKWGSIDSEGKIVSDTKFELQNNLKIDFIGKWHLAEDLNANYYTDM